jgi:putative endonuclease
MPYDNTNKFYNRHLALSFTPLIMIDHKNHPEYAFLLASRSQTHDTANDQKKPRRPASQRLINNQHAQQKGLQAERYAQHLLEKEGFQCIGKRLRCRFGEIDLVMAKGQLLIWVEVRYRRNNKFGGAVASLNHNKWQRIFLTAQYWLKHLTHQHFNGRTPFCRFDVVTQSPQGLNWLQDVRQLT